MARYERPVSRGGRLKRVLAGPAVNLVLALLFAALALRTHGLVRSGLLSASVTNALMVLVNLVPGHTRGGIARGRPNDGLQAWCLVSGKAIPPPAPPRARQPKNARPGGGRPTGGRISVALAVVVVGALAFGHRIPASGAAFVIAVIVVFAVVGDIAAGTGRGPKIKQASQPPSPPPMKICPRCGARVHQRAKLCYCYHRFS